MSIIRINEFRSAQGKSAELSEFLKSLIPFISSSEGCISCQVLRQQNDKSQFIVIEKWTSVECHMKSIANFPTEQMQAAMCLFAGTPKGSYYNC